MGSGRLPAPLTTFVGRVSEIAAVEDALDGGRLVTLTGAGGCGKTRLAVHVAERRIDPHPDGIWFVDLSSVDDDGVGQAVADAVGAVAATDEAIIAAIEGRAALLLLDNCEHVIEVCAPLADTVLRACPALTVLATSREPLGVDGEVVYRVPSLAPDDAAALFVERARRARAGVAEPDAGAVDDICDRLDGIPLAIELAAARMRVFSASQIRDGLHDRFRLLTGGARTSVQRQQTLQASVDWSYDLLQDAERQVLRRLSVFAGGFPLDGAEAVAVGGSVEGRHVLDLVSQLVDKSLVQTGDDDRFRLLETVRQYAAARLAEVGEAEDTRHRHHGWCLLVAQRRVADGETDEAHRARVLAEQENIRRALQWSSELDDPMPLVQLVLSMTNWWASSRRMTEGATWSALAAQRVPEGDDRLRSIVLRACASTMGLSGSWRDALSPALDAVAAARRAGEPKALVWALIQAAQVSRNLADARDDSLLEEALALATDIGYERARAMALFVTGFGYMRDHADSAEGLRYAADALDLARRTQFREVERLAETLVNLCRLLQGELDTVIEPLEASAAALREAGEGFMLSQALGVLVHCALTTGDAAALDRHVTELADLARNSPDRTLADACLLGHALAAMSRGAWQEAASILADQTFEEEWAGSNRALLAGMRTMCECLAGDVAAARRSLAEVERINLPHGLAIPTPYLVGLIALAEGDVDRADDAARRALALVVEPSPALSRMMCLELLASVAARNGRPEEAARVLGGRASYARSVGALPEGLSENWFGGAPEVRVALGDDRFDQLFTEGEALPWDELVAYLQRGRGRRGRPATGWGSVTPTEHQVVELLATGLTNAEIAARLFMSVPTVKSHLTHVYAKLGVSSRSELTAAFVRRDISDL